MKDNQKKSVALVSGVSRGIGRAIALALKQEGYIVVGLYKSSDEKASQIAKGSQIDMQKVDVTDSAQVREALEYVAKTYGNLDILVNNAGHDIPGNIETYADEDWEKMLALNLNAAFFMSKYAIPMLKRSSNALIINISSRLGVDEFVTPGYLPYGVAKGGLNTLTIGLAKELQDYGIRVNAIVPVPTKTDLFDEIFTADEEQALRAAGKVGTPEDVAKSVLQLVNDTSITGTIVIDKRLGK